MRKGCLSVRDARLEGSASSCYVQPRCKPFVFVFLFVFCIFCLCLCLFLVFAQLALAMFNQGADNLYLSLSLSLYLFLSLSLYLSLSCSCSAYSCYVQSKCRQLISLSLQPYLNKDKKTNTISKRKNGGLCLIC